MDERQPALDAPPVVWIVEERDWGGVGYILGVYATAEAGLAAHPSRDWKLQKDHSWSTEGSGPIYCCEAHEVLVVALSASEQTRNA